MTTDDQHVTERPAAAAHTEYHPSGREYVRVGLILWRSRASRSG
jgi:hypothetical protein